MYRTKKNILLFLVLSSPMFLLGQDPATKQDQDFEAWDADGDGVINNTEFGSGINNEGAYFDMYDANSDGIIDDAEWGKAERTYEYLESDYYSFWDADEDGLLNEDELMDGAYDTWDTNQNERIERLEYNHRYNDWVPY